MGALDLMVDGLADIVQQTATLREHHVAAELRRHRAREMRDLDGVVEHILPIARAIAQAPEELHELRMQAMDARIERRLLARLLDAHIDFALCLLHHFLDAGRVDAPILDELLECDASHFAAHRIEA